ncbi:hypothetical protein PENSPDRAFT_672577 [Peniophora sp. CONT]|nr:hypothetical protein PENSPDRAFT_672577 [Peniophora sp. CONT]
MSTVFARASRPFAIIKGTVALCTSTHPCPSRMVHLTDLRMQVDLVLACAMKVGWTTMGLKEEEGLHWTSDSDENIAGDRLWFKDKSISGVGLSARETNIVFALPGLDCIGLDAGSGSTLNTDPGGDVECTLGERLPKLGSPRVGGVDEEAGGSKIIISSGLDRILRLARRGTNCAVSKLPLPSRMFLTSYLYPQLLTQLTIQLVTTNESSTADLLLALFRGCEDSPTQDRVLHGFPIQTTNPFTAPHKRSSAGSVRLAVKIDQWQDLRVILDYDEQVARKLFTAIANSPRNALAL